MIERMTVSELEQVVNHFVDGIVPPNERTVEREYYHVCDEWAELKNPIVGVMAGLDQDRQEAIEEATDVVIGLIGVIHALGGSLENELARKLDTCYRKYNPVKNGELRENGLSWEEAKKLQKTAWQNGQTP